MTEKREQTIRTTTVRRAGSGDARLLATLGSRLFEQTFGAMNDPEDLRSYLATAYRVDDIAAELASDEYASWIAEDAGRAAIGYAVMHRGGTADGVTGERPAEVRRIYADSAWHGRGVGQALMQACIEQARAWHCDVLWLGVWERNPRGIAFYEKTGFRAVGRQRFMVGRDEQHDFVMMRTL